MRNQAMKASRALEETTPRFTPEVNDFRRQKAVPKRTRIVPYVHNPDLAGPRVGEEVMVCHRSTSDDRGNARVSRSDTEKRTIKAVYLGTSEGFQVKDHVGDTWLVRPASLGGAKWETFTVGDKQKVR